MCNQGHVQRSPQFSRNDGLEITPPSFVPLSGGSEAEPLRDAPHMRVHGKDIFAERVEHDAEGSLSRDSRQAGEISLHLMVRHRAEPVQAKGVLSCLDLT